MVTLPPQKWNTLSPPVVSGAPAAVAPDPAPIAARPLQQPPSATLQQTQQPLPASVAHEPDTTSSTSSVEVVHRPQRSVTRESSPHIRTGDSSLPQPSASRSPSIPEPQLNSNASVPSGTLYQSQQPQRQHLSSAVAPQLPPVVPVVVAAPSAAVAVPDVATPAASSHVRMVKRLVPAPSVATLQSINPPAAAMFPKSSPATSASPPIPLAVSGSLPTSAPPPSKRPPSTRSYGATPISEDGLAASTDRAPSTSSAAGSRSRRMIDLSHLKVKDSDEDSDDD
jgi:hypothetical protein